MAYLFRVGFLLFCSFNAYAVESWSGSHIGGSYPNAVACGVAEIAWSKAQWPDSWVSITSTMGPTVGGAYGQTGKNQDGGDTGYMCTGTWTCPVGATKSTTTFGVCIAVPNDKNNCPASGVNAGNYNGQGRSGEKTLCVVQAPVPSGDPALPGCRIKGFAIVATGGNTGPNADSNGWSWVASMSYTGAKCAPTENPPGGSGQPAPDDPLCIPPKVAGTANGKQVCYTPGPGEPTKDSDSTKPDKTTQSSNSDGSKTNTTTSEKTVCTGGICTTTTTTKTSTTGSDGVTSVPVDKVVTTSCKQGPGCNSLGSGSSTTTTTTTSSGGGTTGTGSGGGTTTTTTTTGGGGSSSGGGSGGQGNGGDDEENSQFAGACGAPPFCTGDAVMCAIAAATFATNCVLKDPGTPTPLYDAAKVKTGDLTGSLPNNSTVNLSPSSFDQTELLGGAQGMVDRSITVMKSTINVPFSSINIWLSRLGVILQAVTFLLCARIVIRG